MFRRFDRHGRRRGGSTRFRKQPPVERDAAPGEDGVEHRDMRLGRILVEAGTLKPGHLEEALRIQEELGRKGLGTAARLGEILVKHGYALSDQIDQALELQESSGRTCPSCGEHCPAILLDMGDGDTCPHCSFCFPDRNAQAPIEREDPISVALRPHLETPPVPPELRNLGKYELLREIGRGSAGVVYEAVDTRLNRKVALKLLHQKSGPDVQQFVKEAQLSANLPRHPNIVTVYDAGLLEGHHYIAMELIDGQPFSTWRKKSSVTVRQQARLLRDVALAVHHAHEHGILHCDLKPQNVMVGEGNRPYVTDFGLARRSGKDSWAAQEKGWTAGTPAYMSPEQAMGQFVMDRRTDVYSLGVMLYEVFTGRNPFLAATPEQMLHKTVHERLRPPSSVARSLVSTDPRRTIDALCKKALAKKPSQRHPTARALADELTRWLRGESVARGLSKRTTVPGWAAAAAVAAAVLFCLGIGRWALSPTSVPAAAESRSVVPSADPQRSEEETPTRRADLPRSEPELDRERAELAQKARAEKIEIEAERRRQVVKDEQARAMSDSAPQGGRHPNDWLLALPFENRGIQAPCPPERSIDLQAEMAGKGGPVRWQRSLAGLSAAGTGRAAVLDFARLCSPNTQAVAYALIHVKSPAALDALLLVGSDDGVKIWANGSVIHTHDSGRGVRIDDDRVPLHLQPGWNRLLFKVMQANQGWGLAARIADQNLRPIDELEYDAYGTLPRPGVER